MNNKFSVEIIGILLTIVLAVLLMLPIYSNIGNLYPFYQENIIIIVIAVTFMRYIFLLKHHWVSSSKYIKAVFIFIPIPVFFFLVGALYDFQAFLDEKGIGTILTELSHKKQKSLGGYIKSEMVFFWMAAFLANAYMPIRMILSLWRNINKGTH